MCRGPDRRRCTAGPARGRPKQIRHGRRRALTAVRPGFTLIELLVALSLLSVVLTLLFGGFFQISNSANRLNERLTQRQELRLLADMIAQELLAAQYLKELAKGGNSSGIVAETRPVGDGDFTRIDFHAAVPVRYYRQVPPERDPRLHELGYWVELDEDTGDPVLMRREDFYLDDELSAGGESVRMAAGVEAFLVEFLPAEGAGSSETLEQWTDRWDSINAPNNAKMPLAIRLTLSLKVESGNPLSETHVVNLPGSLTIKAPPSGGDEG